MGAWPRRPRGGRSLLDDGIPEPHVSAGFLRLLRDWDWDGAERELRRAVELSPESTAPHQWLGLVLDLRGRRERGGARAAPGGELDPLSMVVSALAGLHHAFGGDHEAELAQARRTLELDPHQFLGHWAVGSALQNLGRHEEAVAEHRRALELAEGTGFMAPVLARSLALAGRGEEARSLVASGGGDLTLPDGHRPPRAGRDRDEPSTSWPRRPSERDPWIVILAVDPMMRPLRGRPRYEALVLRVRPG